MSTTPNLSLNVYEAADNPLVKTWRDDLSLNSAGSSLVKIDTWAGQTDTRIDDLEESRKTFRIIATSAVQDNYTATSAELVSLVAGIQLQFSADQVNVAGSTLNINSLGSKTIRKINNLGTTVDLELNDIIPNRMYTFEYDGTIWILRSGFTGSQIVINGAVGNIISIDAENNPADSNVAIVGGKITSFGIALGSGVVDDGSGNIMLSDTGVAAGTYVGLTVDGKGRLTGATTPNPSPTGNETLISTDGALSWDAQAPDSAKLGGQLPAYYLSTTAKAADSDKLNGQLASYYLTTTHNQTAKTTLVDADESSFADSEASFVSKKITWANIKASQPVVPSLFERDARITGGAVGTETIVIVTPASNTMWVNVSGNLRIVLSSQSFDVDTAGNWLTVGYATPANRAGKDFCIYAIENGGAIAPLIKFELAATAAPASSRLIGGFHCLCVATGHIVGHTLDNYVAGDILPASVWDLKFSPRRNLNGTYKRGMVYHPRGLWVDIYLMSGTGANTLSVNGGTISDVRIWMDFVDDAGAVGKRLLRDFEFQLAAAGCNEGTNIAGNADPGITGGHTDTAGRRMLSNIGCEDMAGVMWQWLDEQSYQYVSGNTTGTFGWVDQTGGKGQLYIQGATADVKLLAGGDWGTAASCGSRGRLANSYRWNTSANIGGRAGVEPE